MGAECPLCWLRKHLRLAPPPQGFRGRGLDAKRLFQELLLVVYIAQVPVGIAQADLKVRKV